MAHRGLKFGIFLAPFHRVGENPTLAINRDVELLQWLDELGYDEAWIGEHHSAGLGTDRLARTDHRGGGGEDEVHQAGFRRDVVAVSPSVPGGATLGPARPHDPRPRHAGLRAGRADVGRLHAGDRTVHATAAHAGGDGRHHAAAEMRRAGHDENRLVRDEPGAAASGAVQRSAFRDRGRQHDHAVRHDRRRHARRRRAVDRRRPAGRAGGDGDAMENRRGRGGEERQDHGPEELAHRGQRAYRRGRRAGPARGQHAANGSRRRLTSRTRSAARRAAPTIRCAKASRWARRWWDRPRR